MDKVRFLVGSTRPILLTDLAGICSVLRAQLLGGVEHSVPRSQAMASAHGFKVAMQLSRPCFRKKE